MEKERRRAERLKHDSVLELYDDDGRLIRGSAHLVDVSSIGARFVGTMTLDRGERVRGCVRLLRFVALDFAGRVVRINEGTNVTFYGIEFDAAKRARGARNAEGGYPE